MRYLAILDCPVIFSGENTYSMTSIDMCPSVGIARGLISRHIKVVDARVLLVSIWSDEAASKAYFDAEWYERAAALWGDDYQLRLEAIDETNVA
ncbi:MAG: hypothetical protein K2Y56_16305 [Methylobacterium sp.]|uniref:hypothetical protein n=1 Tax=Methylobacterium sp. TaxID=409 RepID=UPI0025DE29E9|nr:hypothetical protein [Methylobacterium sp.]MBX9933074.1 hypothetical protein [Methylobacterium sp.]